MAEISPGIQKSNENRNVNHNNEKGGKSVNRSGITGVASTGQPAGISSG